MRISDWSSDVCSSDRAAITATAKASVRLETQFFIRDRLFHRLGLNFGIHEGKRRKDAHDDHEDKYQKDRCTRHLRPPSNWMRTDRKSTRLHSRPQCATRMPSSDCNKKRRR